MTCVWPAPPGARSTATATWWTAPTGASVRHVPRTSMCVCVCVRACVCVCLAAAAVAAKVCRLGRGLRGGGGA
jgi:hypothetical protein